MRIIVCGGRDYSGAGNAAKMRSFMATLDSGVGFDPPTIVHGDAPGADTLAKLAAIEAGYPVEDQPTLGGSSDEINNGKQRSRERKAAADAIGIRA